MPEARGGMAEVKTLTAQAACGDVGFRVYSL